LNGNKAEAAAKLQEAKASPHSLGKLIEWKPVVVINNSVYLEGEVPTRWGN